MLILGLLDLYWRHLEKTIPPGHFNVEPYVFYSQWPPGFKSLQALPVLSAGIVEFLDIQAALPYSYSWDHGQHGEHIGDLGVTFGLQLVRQQENAWLPDIRMIMGEIFPTGRFENLNPNKLGTDQTGLGSYQTYVGLNLQKLVKLRGEHYLRTRLNFVASKFSPINVHGFNVFGGAETTEGKVNLGTSYAVGLAFEYTLTQNWVPVFEVQYGHSPDSSFSGNPGLNTTGSFAMLNGAASDQISLAPALEYNFTPTLGLIAGVWFSVTGPHSSSFVTGAIALNYYI